MILVTKGEFMKSFLLKAKQFFKRNIYPITVSLCTVLVLTIISVSAYSAINESNNVIDTTKIVNLSLRGLNYMSFFHRNKILVNIVG